MAGTFSLTLPGKLKPRKGSDLPKVTQHNCGRAQWEAAGPFCQPWAFCSCSALQKPLTAHTGPAPRPEPLPPRILPSAGRGLSLCDNLAPLRPGTRKVEGSSLGLGDRRQKGKGPEINKRSRILSSFWRKMRSRFSCSNLLQGEITFACSIIQNRRNIWWVEYLLIYFSVLLMGLTHARAHVHTHTPGVSRR